MATVQVSDVIVPEIFGPYVQQLTEEKARIIQSGVATRDAVLDTDLAGGGLTFNEPSFQDLVNEDENVSTDQDAGVNDSVPKKTNTSNEIQVRLSRNQSWSSTALAAALAGADPMQSIANRVAFYWTRRLQAAFVATINGIFADNAAPPSGGDTHLQNDMTVDIKGVTYVAGVTDFHAEAFIDAVLTMGDSMDELVMVMVHSIVFSRMQKNNLIDFIPDARGEIQIPTFLGREVIVDDGMPNSGGVFESWIFGTGSVRLGTGSPLVPVEVEREPAAGLGGGLEILFNRTEWAIHPVGNAYVGTPPNGGPSNASTANNLANLDSWSRVYPERKQIKIARLITREF